MRQKVKEESGLQINMKKTRIMALGQRDHWMDRRPKCFINTI